MLPPKFENGYHCVIVCCPYIECYDLTELMKESQSMSDELSLDAKFVCGFDGFTDEHL